MRKRRSEYPSYPPSFSRSWDIVFPDFYVVESLYLLWNVQLAHAAGIQTDNFLLHAIGVTVVFADDLRFVFTVAVARNLDFYLAQLSFYSFFGVTITVVFLR
jgi:hypothetical protein